MNSSMDDLVAPLRIMFDFMHNTFPMDNAHLVIGVCHGIYCIPRGLELAGKVLIVSVVRTPSKRRCPCANNGK